MSTSQWKKRVLDYLAQHKGGALTLKELAKKVKVKGKDDYRVVRDLMDDLDRRGIVNVDDKGRISYTAERKKTKSEKPGRIVGRLTMTRRDFGFVQVEGGEEIFVGAKFLHTALHGDKVAVVLFARPVTRHRGRNDKSVEGEIAEVIERGSPTLTGRLEVRRNFSFVVPDDDRISRDIYVAQHEGVEAHHGDKVVVRLLPWTDEHVNPEGTIEEVLGPSGDPRVEVMSVARNFNLPLSFPPEVEREAEQLSGQIPAQELQSRLDFRTAVTFTIDPEDAKDFDDALSIEHLDGGRVRLGVHIADVSYYVREGSALDREALSRGTSVYMVNEVIPMLPEKLSNNLCSLRPNEDRLTYSVVMDVDADGTVEHYNIGRSVIHSARRFSYEEVQQIIDSGKGDHAVHVLALLKLSRVLLRQRRKDGSIDFDTGEAKFKFDPAGLPIQIIKKTRLDAHRLVEECMLLANKTVAEHVGKARKDDAGRPFIYRVHDVPDPSRLLDLANFVKGFGYSLDVRNGVPSRALQRLLDKVAGTDVESVINEVALRTMAKAVYSDRNIGHYGLAFAHYTHFTSPIRRYPDLIVHRLLTAYAQGPSSELIHRLKKELPGIALQSSERERVAAEAERTSVKVMQVEYMKRHVSDEFDGVIGGVTNFGIFVKISDLLVEGLVPIRELADDYYLFDEKQYSLRGRSRGRVYRLGDHVRVRVVSVDPEERRIDMAIVE